MRKVKDLLAGLLPLALPVEGVRMYVEIRKAGKGRRNVRYTRRAMDMDKYKRELERPMGAWSTVAVEGTVWWWTPAGKGRVRSIQAVPFHSQEGSPVEHVRVFLTDHRPGSLPSTTSHAWGSAGRWNTGEGLVSDQSRFRATSPDEVVGVMTRLSPWHGVREYSILRVRGGVLQRTEWESSHAPCGDDGHPPLERLCALRTQHPPRKVEDRELPGIFNPPCGVEWHTPPRWSEHMAGQMRCRVLAMCLNEKKENYDG
jgi:hypothetical protein